MLVYFDKTFTIYLRNPFLNICLKILRIKWIITKNPQWFKKLYWSYFLYFFQQGKHKIACNITKNFFFFLAYFWFQFLETLTVTAVLFQKFCNITGNQRIKEWWYNNRCHSRVYTLENNPTPAPRHLLFYNHAMDDFWKFILVSQTFNVHCL